MQLMSIDNATWISFKVSSCWEVQAVDFARSNLICTAILSANSRDTRKSLSKPPFKRTAIFPPGDKAIQPEITEWRRYRKCRRHTPFSSNPTLLHALGQLRSLWARRLDATFSGKLAVDWL